MAGTFRFTTLGDYETRWGEDMFVMRNGELVRLADAVAVGSEFQLLPDSNGTFGAKADNYLEHTVLDSAGRPITAESGFYLSYEGLDSNAVLTGSDRNDILAGGNGNDRLLGGKGDDRFIGSAGNDEISGGDGVDTVDFSGSLAGVTVALDRTGADGRTAFSSVEIAIGSNFSDTLTASGRTTRLEGGGGNDTLEAAEVFVGGWRFLDGGDGTDTVSYAASKDGVTVDLSGGSDGSGAAKRDIYVSIENVIGSQGRDELIGDGKNNVLEGGSGADVLDGGDGSDTASYQHSREGVEVHLSLGSSRQNGAKYSDTYGDRLIDIENLTGSSFGDRLIGDGNGNVLDGGAGDDYLQGLGGDDVYIVDSYSDFVDESNGYGTDTVQSNSISIQLYQSIFKGEVENATLTGSLDKNLFGNALANTLTGNDGSNQISGGDGNDTLKGGAGNDILRGGRGSDRLDGGTDFDTAYYDGSFESPITANFVTGTVLTGNGEVDTLVSIEKIVGTSESDTFVMGAGANGADGSDGSDTLDYSRSSAGVSVNLATNAVSGGYAKGDTIRNFENVVGSSYADTLTGNDQSNQLDGGLGADKMAGGAGNDTYLVDNALDVVVEAAGGGTADRVVSSVSFTLKTGAEVEQLVTTAPSGTSAINFAGNEFAQLIQGNAGANKIDGKAGADTLTGGGGSDSFIFSTALASGNVDVITDFANASGNNDTIRLTKSVFAALTGNANTTLTADQFVANASGSATNELQHIIYETDTGKLFYDADGNKAGGVAAVHFATIADFASIAGTALSAGDFYLV